MAPSVAVPTYHLVDGRVQGWVSGGFGLPERYVEALQRAGATALLVPATTAVDARAVLDAVDGLLLAGGGDVDPSRYGMTSDKTYGIDPNRDAVELALLHEAMVRRIPVLAICRGMQVVNVAFGGTLVPHLPDQDGVMAHGEAPAGLPVLHDVKVEGGSRLADLVAGPVLAACTSHHHQGIDRLGAGLSAVAWAEDGLVEAVEHPDRWLVGVQWHPETTAADDPLQQGLFDRFVAEARRRD